jgi:hypothetical protein
MSITARPRSSSRRCDTHSISSAGWAMSAAKWRMLAYQMLRMLPASRQASAPSSSSSRSMNVSALSSAGIGAGHDRPGGERESDQIQPDRLDLSGSPAHSPGIPPRRFVVLPHGVAIPLEHAHGEMHRAGDSRSKVSWPGELFDLSPRALQPLGRIMVRTQHDSDWPPPTGGLSRSCRPCWISGAPFAKSRSKVVTRSTSSPVPRRPSSPGWSPPLSRARSVRW